MFDLKIPRRRRISCHCLNIKHRCTRIIFTWWAHAVRRSRLGKHSWHCINSLQSLPQKTPTTHCCFVIDMLISTQYSPSSILHGALFVMWSPLAVMEKGRLFCCYSFFVFCRNETWRELTHMHIAVWFVKLQSVSEATVKFKTDLIMVIIWNKEQFIFPSCSNKSQHPYVTLQNQLMLVTSSHIWDS